MNMDLCPVVGFLINYGNRIQIPWQQPRMTAGHHKPADLAKDGAQLRQVLCRFGSARLCAAPCCQGGPNAHLAWRSMGSYK